MSFKYSTPLGSTKHGNYTKEALDMALEMVKTGGLSDRQAEKLYKIPRRTIYDKVHGKHNKQTGGQLVFSAEEENQIIKVCVVCANWGQPLEKLDIRMLAKRILDKQKRTVSLFKNNVPGRAWIEGFLRRHRHEINVKLSQNIKTARAEKTQEEMTDYFNQLKISLDGIPPQNIINYDETNFSFDAGRTKAIYKRGTKYPERVQNSSKAAISVMFAGTATGHLLPPYVVYKSTELWSTWCEGGPPRARYNRTKSGWFDAVTFHDWFKSILIPYLRRLPGPKAVIGDNLSSHFNAEIVQYCEQNQIRFIMLPPNSTHISQPLDVAFFGPMKRVWREILKNYIIVNKEATTLSKDVFPGLLAQLMDKLNETGEENLKSGFETTGIFPLNPSKLLQRLPNPNVVNEVGEAVVEHLKTMRGSSEKKTRKRKKKLNVTPGASISLEDFNNPEVTHANPDSVMNNNNSAAEMTNDENEGTENSSSPSTHIQVNKWVLVKLSSSRSIQHFIGQIVQVMSTAEVEVSFLRAHDENRGLYVHPYLVDKSIIQVDQIVKILDAPIELRRGYLKFS